MTIWRRLAWPLFVAQRYLFSKKSHNTINIITFVSMCGVAVGTMALVCVLSVLNGFESLVNQSFTAFDPDLRITSTEGRIFESDSDNLKKIRQMPEIAVVVEVCGSNALAAYEGRQTAVEVRGVSPNYVELNDVHRLVIDGELDIKNRALVGVGVVNLLNTNYQSPLTLYAPKRTATINLARPETAFSQQEVWLSGVFATGQSERDNSLIFLPIEQAQQLFDYLPNEISALELKLAPNASLESVQKTICELLGSKFLVQNRYEQQADFYRILQIEKWITFLILAFILLIAICNIIGSLSMLMINKKADIDLFFALGTPKRSVKWLFLFEGWMITIYGAIVGIVLGVLICLAQQIFGIVKLGTGFVVDNYPVELQALDVLIVFLTVVVLGFALSAYPVSFLRRNRLQTDNN